MAKKNIALLCVICSTAHSYRRAGFELQPGPNELKDVTPEQVALLETDPRISVTYAEDPSSTADDAAGNLVSGVLPELVTLIAELDHTDRSLFTNDGMPLAKVFPKGTTAEQRETAWRCYQTQQLITEAE